MNKYTLNELVKEMEDKYDLSSVVVCDNPKQLIKMLLSNFKKTNDYNNLFLGEIFLSDLELEILRGQIERIVIDKVPPQYIMGKVNIYNEEYFVTPDVLIPRQDTETLIETAINEINKNCYKNMLDLCTGSGVVGVSIANNSSIEKVTMVDISEPAISVANINIEKNNVTQKCQTIISDMFSKLYETETKYDIIVSNPPYLRAEELHGLSDYVKNEPVIALDGGNSGLEFYEKIFNEARNFLNLNGTVAVEIGCTQANEILNIIQKYSEYSDVEVIKDINSKDRVILCRFQKQ